MEAATPEFETEVLTEFGRKLQEYCDRVHRSGRSGAIRPFLVVSIVTALPVPNLRERLYALAARVLGRRLPGAHLEQMFFAVDKSMSGPLFAVGVEERPAAAPPPDDGEVARWPVRILTLSFGHPHKFVFWLEAWRVWVPIRRGEPAGDLRLEIALPEYLNILPHGVLLELRYRDGVVELRRTAARPEYHVAIDDRRLDRGERMVLNNRGQIVLGDASGNGNGRAELRYVLMERL